MFTQTGKIFLKESKPYELVTLALYCYFVFQENTVNADGGTQAEAMGAGRG